MFIPNSKCFIRRAGKSFDRYGQVTHGAKTAIKYSLVRYDTKTEDSTVRADSSATRGNIKEFHATGRVLVAASVKPVWGDLLIILGKVYRVKEVEPRFNVLGILDHYELDFEKAEDKYGDEVN